MMSKLSRQNSAQLHFRGCAMWTSTSFALCWSRNMRRQLYRAGFSNRPSTFVSECVENPNYSLPESSALAKHSTNCAAELNAFPTVRRCQVDNGPERNDPSGINFFVRHVVVPLDVIDADRLGDSGVLIQVEQVALQIQVIDNASQVAFEVAVIDDVEANERAEEPPIGFDDALAK